jgi:transposase
MEKKLLFIGIDFSKSKFDVSALESVEQDAVAQATFDNTKEGFEALLKWVSKQSKIGCENWLFCGEHTGLYSRSLAVFLARKQLFVWLENPLQIKQSTGIKRIKTDRADSLVIATYACRFCDRATAYRLANNALESLQILHTYRARLVKEKVLLKVPATELRRVINRDSVSRFIYEESQRKVKNIEKEIEKVETLMHKTIMESELRENYLLTLSVKGIGIITATCLIVHTDNFAAFENARQLACYCGCAPFPNESGTINKGTHISHLANKYLKTLLTSCALSAIKHDKELSAYYHRKIAEGKNKYTVINNVRNKLLQIVFAVVKHKIPYRENYLNPWEQCA